MKRPEIDIIAEILPFIDKRIARGTIEHLILYIEYLESLINKKELEEVK